MTKTKPTEKKKDAPEPTSHKPKHPNTKDAPDNKNPDAQYEDKDQS